MFPCVKLLAGLSVLLLIDNDSQINGQIGSAIKDSLAEFDLLQTIYSDTENINNGGISYIEGTGGFPAFAISQFANIRSPFKLLVPEKLDEFALMVSIKPNKIEGYLFSIVNSMETIIQFGLKISPAHHNNFNISLIYNDPHGKSVSDALITFTLPYEPNKWIDFALQVFYDKIVVYRDCYKIQEINVTKEPRELIFESASTFYLGGAGNFHQKFEVISSKAKGMIGAFICLIFLSAMLVTASSKGWLWAPGMNKEHVAARIQGAFQFLKLYGYPDFIPMVCNQTKTVVVNEKANSENDFTDYGNENDHQLQPPPEFKNYGYRKGEKGDRGMRGPPGDSIRGPPGPPGMQGPKGECTTTLDSSKFELFKTAATPQQCSCNINNFMEILRNETVKEILRGPPGLTGRSGLPGPPGEGGPRGEKGDRGPEGLQGNKGEQGLDGAPGLPGPPGENYEAPSNWDSSRIFKESMIPGIRPGYSGGSQKGEKGDSAQKGERGIQGVKGERGLNGAKGERGESVQGPPGQKGEPGKSGEKGPPGLPGTLIYSDMQNITGCSCNGQKGEKGSDGGVVYANGTTSVIRGEKGDRGLRGKKGKQGPVGPPGPPGRPAAQGDIGVPGYPDLKNVKGRSGLPGLKGEPGQKGEKGVGIKGERGSDGMPGLPGTSGFGAGTVTFQNTDMMLKMSSSNPVGTIAFILDEEALVVRVNRGWQYLSLGTLLPLTTQPMTTTSVSPSYGPDFQASNLLNSNLLKSPDSYTFTTPPEYESWNPKMLRMVAMNEPFYGNLQGMRNADMNCHRQARRAGLVGTFKAFLSTRVQNLDSIVKQEDRELPITNLRGDVLFNSWNSIFSAQGGFFSQAPRIYSFSGKNVLNDPTWPQKVIWHGAKMDSMDSNCDGWHSAASDKVGLGSSLMSNKLLSDQEMYSCNNKNIVLCIEVLNHNSDRKKRDLFQNEEYPEDESLRHPFIESSYQKYKYLEDVLE